MNRHEGERLITGLTKVVRELMVEEGKAHRDNGKVPELPPATVPGSVMQPRPGAGMTQLPNADVLDAMYRAFKERLIDELKVDPVFVQLLANQSEIVVEIQPRRITLDGTTLRGRVARLIAAGWVDVPRATGAFRRELARTGADPGGGGNLSDVLNAFVRDGLLVRDGSDYAKAAGLKVTEKVIEAT